MVKRRTVLRIGMASLAATLFAGLSATHASAHHAAGHTPPLLQDVAFEQRLGTRLPLDLPFQDETGRAVHLGEYFGRKPVVLVFAYYECPMLCPVVLTGLLRSLRTLPFDVGREFTVVTVSFDPRDTPVRAAARKEAALQRYGRPGAEAGWHFLTGEEDAIRALTRAAGFAYAYDPEKAEYAHPAGILVATPAGTIARYLFGLEYSARDLRLALLEAATETIGSPIDRVLVYCYRYDPATGTYGVVIMNVIRLAGLATALTLGACIVVMVRLDRRRRPGRAASG